MGFVGGVESYGYPQHPITWSPHQANLDEELTLHDPSKIQKPALPPPFMKDKFILQTNQDLNPVAGSLAPVLKKPDPLEIDEIKEFAHKMDVLGAKFERLELEAQRIQRELANDTSLILGQELKTLQTIQQNLLQEYNDAWQKMYDKSKSSTIVSWIDNMFTMGFLAATVIGVGLAIVTAGVSLAVTAAAVGLMGIGKAASATADAVLKHELGKDQALIGEVQYSRDMNKDQISEIIRSSKALGQFLLTMSKLTREFLTNYQAAIAANFNN